MGGRGTPTFMDGRQPSARHHTVNVRMRLQSLSPGVQDAEKADLGTEMSWIRGYFQQGSSRGVEQESEKGFLVLPDQWREQVRNSEDEMKIVHRQQFLLALGKPLLASTGLTLRAMPVPTGVVGDPAEISATGAHIEMAAQCSSTATGNGPEHLDLRPGQPCAIAFPKPTPSDADDVGNLPGWPGHYGLSSNCGGCTARRSRGQVVATR